MPWSKLALACGVVIAMAGTAAAGPFGGELTATANFGLGEMGIEGTGGFLGPGGIFDFGLGNRQGRIGIEYATSMWSHGSPTKDMPTPPHGHVWRLDAVARMNVVNWDFGPRDKPRKGTIHFYLEGGVGKEWIRDPDHIRFSRPDFTLGVGMQQVAKFSQGMVGGVFSMKMIFARDDSARGVICKGTCAPTGGTDVGVVFMYGITLGS